MIKANRKTEEHTIVQLKASVGKVNVKLDFNVALTIVTAIAVSLINLFYILNIINF